ncbi:MAG: AAA family ATPase [Gemmatimonadetes bacterium]|nr:AAA family ATPase [Gemmatimonadota bacterium]
MSKHAEHVANVDRMRQLADPPQAEKPSANGDRASVITCLADVEPERVTWLWKGRIPLGKITLLEGDPGTGKTTVALDMAARISTGRPMPGGGPRHAAAVLFLTAEDGLADTIRPRLDAMGGDPSRVYSLAIREPDGYKHGVEIPGDLSYVRDVIERHSIVFVVVDPLNAFLADYIDTHKDHGIRRAMAPLAQLAEETGAAIVPIRHLNKSSNGKAMYRGGGSIAYAAAARSVLLVAEDPEDEAYRVLAPVKHNLTAPPASLRFHLDADLDGATRVIWDGESQHTANTLCAQPTDPEERTTARELADFLREMLEGAPRTVKEVQTLARAAGYDVANVTLQRARRRIGAETGRSGFGGECVWSLPAHSDHIVVTQEGVTSMEGETPESLAKTPGPHSDHSIVITDPMISMEEADYERLEREAIQGEASE